VELRGEGSRNPEGSATDSEGRYTFEAVLPGRYQLSFKLINFAGQTRRDVSVSSGRVTTADAVLHLTLSADVTVTGKRTFANLADVEDPAENLVGIASSASQGAVTAQQIAARPIMRAGEVLETAPGVLISQHSGEGKGNQIYLRGFNLDHGTDFSTTVAGVPVNLPTHAHGHGYTDVNFLIPELVSGVQYSKGPYYAEQGDFSAAGVVNVAYVNTLDETLVSASAGEEGWRRALLASSLRVGSGRLLGAFEFNHNDGPWTRSDDYRRVSAVLRYSQGDAINGVSITGMAYRGTWNSTDQLPDRAIASGQIGRFDTIDPSNGGRTHRYSAAVEPVTPLVRAKGAEVGLRTVSVPHLQTTVTLWTLALDSELLFVGDAGTTESGRPSHRAGVEISNYWSPRPWLTFDGDLAFSHARFTDVDPAGDYIPGAVEAVGSFGVSVNSRRRVFGSARLRYFGPRPLTEDGSVRSKATSLVSVQAGYRLNRHTRATLDVFNLFDQKVSDIDYFYASRLHGEPLAGVGDIHTHPALPRSARLYMTFGW